MWQISEIQPLTPQQLISICTEDGVSHPDCNKREVLTELDYASLCFMNVFFN